MPEKLLSDLAVRNARLPAGRREMLLGDGGNLYLRLRPRSKDWIFAWKVAGKKQKMMLGSYPDLGLADARQRAREARLQLSEGKHLEQSGSNDAKSRPHATRPSVNP